MNQKASIAGKSYSSDRNSSSIGIYSEGVALSPRLLIRGGKIAVRGKNSGKKCAKNIQSNTHMIKIKEIVAMLTPRKQSQETNDYINDEEQQNTHRLKLPQVIRNNQKHVRDIIHSGMVENLITAKLDKQKFHQPDFSGRIVGSQLNLKSSQSMKILPEKFMGSALSLPKLSTMPQTNVECGVADDYGNKNHQVTANKVTLIPPQISPIRYQNKQ